MFGASLANHNVCRDAFFPGYQQRVDIHFDQAMTMCFGETGYQSYGVDDGS
jgi:hypothetical protein